MKTTEKHNERIASLKVFSVWPHYIAKIEKKGRTQAELYEVIQWLTGFTENDVQCLLEDKVTFQEFFEKATIHPNARLIKGVICGYRIEEIDNELTRKVRYLDKVVDELAKGKKLEKIMRTV